MPKSFIAYAKVFAYATRNIHSYEWTPNNHTHTHIHISLAVALISSSLFVTLIRNVSSLLLFDSMSHVKKWQKKLSPTFQMYIQHLDSA